jgi:aerobic carbon-monoxide dehydrogenase medium subunit
MKAPAFVYRRPNDAEEVLSLLADHQGDAQLLAGGQSLMPALNMRLASPDILLDINRIEALGGIEERHEAVRIGATVRHADVLDSPLVARRLPLLAMAVPHVGHPAVRNRGTIGGSIAFADPSAEIPAIAVALNARIVLRRRGTERTVAARIFFCGLYQTARQDDEMIFEIVFPA